MDPDDSDEEETKQIQEVVIRLMDDRKTTDPERRALYAPSGERSKLLKDLIELKIDTYLA